jgi:hypothetical protein
VYLPGFRGDNAKGDGKVTRFEKVPDALTREWWHWLDKSRVVGARELDNPFHLDACKLAFVRGWYWEQGLSVNLRTHNGYVEVTELQMLPGRILDIGDEIYFGDSPKSPKAFDAIAYENQRLDKRRPIR